MRPQDIAILLKIISLEKNEEVNNKWRNIDLATSLKISPAEISTSLNRSKIAKLIDSSKRQVAKNSLKEFLVYGLKYVFPVELGAIVKGIPTAHSASPINNSIVSNGEKLVWAYFKGTVKGQTIKPLYKSLPKVVENDLLFYELMAITDYSTGHELNF
ncbi:hypothetical protein ACE193_19160 [Bernardetia sp. OM2101]|uniref:hypothetical protein n=1 Tax=Bernardetia sp. OM2101 TaxID=3344876 RepID=UPI0035D03E9C